MKRLLVDGGVDLKRSDFLPHIERQWCLKLPCFFCPLLLVEIFVVASLKTNREPEKALGKGETSRSKIFGFKTVRYLLKRFTNQELFWDRSHMSHPILSCGFCGLSFFQWEIDWCIQLGMFLKSPVDKNVQ